MVACEKESFNLDPPSPIDGPVEVWMTKVEESMKESLHGITKAGVYNYAQMDRGDWILDANTLGMVTLAGSQIWWTWEVEDAFRLVGTGDKYALKNLEQKLTGQLNDLVAMVRTRAAKESDIPNFKGSFLGRFPLVLADFWTSDHISERSRRVGAFSGTRARGTLILKRR